MAKDMANSTDSLLQELYGQDLAFDQLRGESQVTIYEQLEVVEGLAQNRMPDSFFFVVNLEISEIEYLSGIAECLGYSDHDLSFKKFLEIIHPANYHSITLQARNLMRLLRRGAIKIQFMTSRYSVLLCLRHYRGHYVVVKKTASVFQYDNQNRLLAYLNEFTILNDSFIPIAATPRIFDNKERLLDLERQLGNMLINSFIQLKIFSKKELQVARMLSYESNITQQEIASRMAVSINTVQTYTKRFLVKARNIFAFEFHTVAEAAKYLKENGFL